MRVQPSPSEGIDDRQPDLFRARLDHLIDLHHPLVQVSQAMPWADLIGEVGEALPAVPEGPGRRPLPARLVLGLLYLKYAYNLSDEAVCGRWLENPYYQYFCGEVTFQTRLPCDPSSLTRYRKHLGEAGVEQLLAQTIEAARHMKAVTRRDFKRVIVDTTVQEKAIAFPTDSRLLEVARSKLVQDARQEGIALRQSYARIGPRLNIKAGRYAHARQYKRMRRAISKQRTIVGRLIRDIQRKANADSLERLADTLTKAQRLHAQQKKTKNKLYAWHAPEVECISKGKARQPYEFGVKVGIAISATKGLILGAKSFPGNPYDGDTLQAQHTQASGLTGTPASLLIVDQGYRARKVPDTTVIHKGLRKSLTPAQWRWLKRRQAVEPTIGHLKDDHRMRRNFLKGSQGDAYNPVLAAAGFNLQWLMRFIILCYACILAMRIPVWQPIRPQRWQVAT